MIDLVNTSKMFSRIGFNVQTMLCPWVLWGTYFGPKSLWVLRLVSVEDFMSMFQRHGSLENKDMKQPISNYSFISLFHMLIATFNSCMVL